MHKSIIYQEGITLREITYAEAIRESLDYNLMKDKNVFLIGEDIGFHGGAFSVTKGLFNKYGCERIIDTPISENLIVGAAVGAGAVGGRPVCEIMYMDFITNAMDQIVNQAAKMRFMCGGKISIPVVLRTPAGAGRGNAAQHMQSLEAWFCHIPGLKVVMPSNPYDAKGLLNSSIVDNSPVIFIEHKLLYSQKGNVPEENYYIPLGKCEIKRIGEDITIIATSKMVLHALNAAEQLEKNYNIIPEVIDPRTLVPLDIETILESVKKTNKAIVVHEAVSDFGIGAEIAFKIQKEAFDYLDSPIGRVCGLYTPVPYSKPLEDYFIPDEEKIIKEVLEIFGKY
ncbi:MAG: alpha-ketoacid dehydrogenase subunit beta [Clostridia bacterium]|nr:alpha-ketoacid dehydrogenase subunit beta [Clostridia bacterium]